MHPFEQHSLILALRHDARRRSNAQVRSPIVSVRPPTAGYTQNDDGAIPLQCHGPRRKRGGFDSAQFSGDILQGGTGDLLPHEFATVGDADDDESAHAVEHRANGPGRPPFVGR